LRGFISVIVKGLLSNTILAHFD